MHDVMMTSARKYGT